MGAPLSTYHTNNAAIELLTTHGLLIKANPGPCYALNQGAGYYLLNVYWEDSHTGIT